jgi:hypothetical protein
MEMIAGEVSGVNPSRHRVVIFSLASGKWFVQPYYNAPYTSIDANRRFETEVHLGTRYAALLVRPSYNPPSTTISLPSKGGDVLAVTEHAPGSHDQKGGGAITAPSPHAFQWWWLVVIAVLLSSLIALTGRGEHFVSAVGTSLSKVFEGGDKLLGLSLRAAVDWLKSNKALLTLLGLICLMVAGASAYADYYILNQSLIIFWPISETTWALAANIVALQALVGICLHLFRDNGQPVRSLLYGLLIVLLASQFAIAYLRVIEIEAVTESEHIAAQVENDAGSLSINDLSAIVESQPIVPSDPQSQAASPYGAGHKSYLSPYAILSGVITVACALSETFGMYAAVSYAGGALVWLGTSPALGALTLASCVFRFLSRSRIVEVARVILAAWVDTLDKLGSIVVRGVRAALRCVRATPGWLRSLLPGLAQSFRCWQKARLRYKEDVKGLHDKLKLERKYEMEMLEIELRAKKEKAVTYWKQHAAMTGKLQEAVENILDGHLAHLKDSLRQISEKLSEDVVEMAAEKARKNAEPLVDRVSSAIAEVYGKTSDMLISGDGYEKANNCSAAMKASRRQ